MTMLEKMAEAFAAHVRANAHGDWIGGDARCLEVDGTIDLPDALRAALLAIREPDGEMGQVGYDTLPWVMVEPFHVEAAFTAMIDAILNEKPEAGS